MPVDPWDVYSEVAVFNLTTNMQRYSFTFTMSATTDTNACIEFDLGAKGAIDVYVDNVVMSNLSGPLPTPTSTPVIEAPPATVEALARGTVSI